MARYVKRRFALCTKKHATSKIKNIDDIFKIYSYGFRGEALATIAEVSKTEIISATKEDEFCNKIILEDGK
jgi:DNA mismatch repair protein MutL